MVADHSHGIRGDTLPHALCFDSWRVVPQEGIAYHGAEQIHLRPKLIQVLACLASHAGEVISKDELAERVWAPTKVSDGVLQGAINNLRVALGDSPKDPHYIRTIPKQGYQFIAPVAMDYAPPEPPPASIALLRFVDMSPDGGQQHLCDGIAEELLNKLAHRRYLKVSARTSSFPLTATAMSMREIGELLGVRYALEGSVRTFANQFRLTVQLIDCEAQDHRWSESYTRDLDDFFAVCDELADTIVGELDLAIHRPAQDGAEADPGDLIAASPMPTLAVLPFANPGRDADQEDFSDGLLEEVISILAQDPGLLLIERNSACAFKGSSATAQQVACRLGARYVVEGSVRRLCDRARVTTQLIDAHTATYLWAHSYDYELSDPIMAQVQIAERIAGAVAAQCRAARLGREPVLPVEKPGVYEI